MKAIVGYTGFVGGNIFSKGDFDAAYNSKNIEQAYGTNPDLLVFAGLRAEKYLANSAPDQDMALILQAEENISRIRPKKLVLISSVDVFKTPISVDESSEIDTIGLHPYGLNRYRLEQWVRGYYPDALVIRLPGLFGKNLKKNFIYDFINIIPFMLKEQKMDELAAVDPELRDWYCLQGNGFYKLNPLPAEDKVLLRSKFKALGFSALSFTDSRSVYQFYNLQRLWDDICTALEHSITLLHPATEPVAASELFRYLTGRTFLNELSGEPAYYDYRTIHDDVFNGADGYICGKDQVMREIAEFVREYEQCPHKGAQ